MQSIIQKKLFDKHECEYFKSLSNHKLFKRSEVLSSDGVGISEYRTSDEILIYLNSEVSSIILEKIKEFDVKTLPEYFMILKYNKSQEFKRHNDTSGLVNKNRYKTLIIQLSDESDYEGGELCIFENNKTTICSKEIGNSILFNSSIYHSANKIKEGMRYSMVFWLSIHNFGLNKSLI